MPDLFKDFLASDDTLRIYREGKLIFASKKDGLQPLMEYIARNPEPEGPVTIYDKVMGNAAALLAVKVRASEVFSPLGSDLAIKTLQKAHIKYHLTETVPCIQRADGKGMCPMEELSMNKEPEEFYGIMKARMSDKTNN